MSENEKSKLAILGGTPVRETLLPYGKQFIDYDDIQAVVSTLEGDFLTTGPSVYEFEKKVCEYTGAKYAVAVCNGTAALHMACYACGLVEGDEVIVSSMTFAASSNAVLYVGATPVFADINPNTYNIDVEDLKRKITPRTKAIIAVDYTGQVVDMDSINEIAKEHNLIVIEDAAHSLGSTYKNKKVGTLADMTMFSFHPVKTITTGEGGMIVTDNKELYDKMVMFRSHGITKNPAEYINKSPENGAWYHEQQFLGYNYRMTDIQASLGISQLDKLDKFINRRKQIVKMYNDAFSELYFIKTPEEAEFSDSAWHLYVIKLRLYKLNCTRREFFDALVAENIGVNVHYIPVNLHPYYEQLGYGKGVVPVAEALYNTIITLPLFPGMTDGDVSDVIEAVNKVVEYYKKDC